MSAREEKIPTETAKKPKPEQAEKNVKLDKAKQIDIKEKVYITRQVETSITLLDSPEVDVVLEALLFISKYADMNKNNSVCLLKSGVIEKLLNNFSRNICILRLSLRLLSVVLNLEDSLYEIDQDKFDEHIINIANMYIEHKDAHIKEFCVEILAKIASSCRITTLIFRVDLLNPIFENMKNSKNNNILYHTLLLFFKLIDAPAAVSALAECAKFEPQTIITHIYSKEANISNLALDIIEKLSKYGLSFLQEGFRKQALVENMFKIIMDDAKENQHIVAIKIIHNCLNSEESCSYYIESLEFLEFCQWIKTCHPKFLLDMIEVFIKLTSIPNLKQILFDLSVEESILYFFRLKNKKVMNKTCEAISNMTTHKYCCEHMLTDVIAETLIEILSRQNDDVDPYNEVALKTVFHFVRRNHKGLNILLNNNFKPVLLDYFYNKNRVITEESFQMVLDILYKCIVHPKFQQEFVDEETLREIVNWFQSKSPHTSKLCCEIMTNITTVEIFRKFFLRSNLAQICTDVLKSAEDIDLITQILYLIFTCLIYEDIAMAFLQKGLLAVLKQFNEYILLKIPICKRVFHLALNYYPPIKFFETGRLEIIDKLPNKFYVINGVWNGPFPFLEILEMMQVSPYPTIYLVDYSYEVVKNEIVAVQSQSTLQTLGSVSGSLVYSTTSTTSKSFSGTSLSLVPSAFDINYGNISKDIYLPRYIYHLKKYDKFVQGPMEDRIRFLAEYVDTLLCGPKEIPTLPQKIHEFKLHIQCLKQKLGTNIIPIGFLRLGFHCERALLFKALADKISIPCSLIKGSLKIYWNEVALFEEDDNSDQQKIKFYVVDLMNDLGNLMLVGSREANKYCNLN